MPARVQVEHEGDQGALQPGARVPEDEEARAGKLDAALEVDDAERLAQLPVWLRLEVVSLLDALGTHYDVARLIRSNGHVLRGDVWHFEEESVQLGLDLAQWGIEAVDVLAEGAAFLE